MPEKKKDPYRFLSFKFFILTFLITLIILCLVGLPILLASGQDPSSQSSKPEEYTPDWSDKMTLLLQIKEESGTPLRFFLVGLHPAQERLYVTPLPGETWLSAGQKENTLTGFTEYGGIYLGAEALVQSCQIGVERTASITVQRLCDLVNRLGGMEWEPHTALTVDTLSGETLSISPGRQKLDGERVAALMAPGQGNQTEQLERAGELLVELLNQHLSPRVSGTGDRFAEIANFFITDFSYSDYLNRADALDAISSIIGCASLEMASGAYSAAENSRFSLSEEGLALLKKRYPQ